MKLIVISSSKSVENETVIITQLFEAGLPTFHLRKPNLTTSKMKKFIKAIPENFHDRIIIHSHHDLARKFKLRGIHLTTSHTRKKLKTWLSLKLIKYSNPNIEITTSFNNMGQLLEPNVKYNYNYVFLSPIFDSLSSKFQGGFTEVGLKAALEKSEFSVIARGGVDADAIEKAKRIGFDGLAFYSSIWRKQDPTAEFNKILARFKELNIPFE